MGQRPGFLVVVFLLVATGLPTGADADGVAVIAGKREGRTSTEPAEAAINEPFATAFDLEGRLWGVEFTRANRVFSIDPAAAGGAGLPTFVAGLFHRADPQAPAAPAGPTAVVACARRGARSSSPTLATPGSDRSTSSPASSRPSPATV